MDAYFKFGYIFAKTIKNRVVVKWNQKFIVLRHRFFELFYSGSKEIYSVIQSKSYYLKKFLSNEFLTIEMHDNQSWRLTPVEYG